MPSRCHIRNKKLLASCVPDPCLSAAWRAVQVKVALCQLLTSDNKDKNISTAQQAIKVSIFTMVLMVQANAVNSHHCSGCLLLKSCHKMSHAAVKTMCIIAWISSCC